jgi:hypothetical protein
MRSFDVLPPRGSERPEGSFTLSRWRQDVPHVVVWEMELRRFRVPDCCRKPVLLIAAACLFIFVLALASVAGQGALSVSYRAPRTPDGKPDLNGIWQVLNTAAWDLQDHTARLGVPAGQGVVEGNEIPYQPWAVAKKAENLEKAATADPLAECFLPGVPRVTYLPFPFQIAQTPNAVALLYEWSRTTRIIYTDGSKHPEGLEFWMGDSRGRWEGETLVADVKNFNGNTWFDKAGNFHSDALHAVERYTRIDPDHLSYEVTIEDPKVFTRPWKISMILYRRSERNLKILEYECLEFLQEQRYQPGK